MGVWVRLLLSLLLTVAAAAAAAAAAVAVDQFVAAVPAHRYSG